MSDKKCPTCGHPLNSETPCIHVLHPELFVVNNDGLMVAKTSWRDQDMKLKGSEEP